jgi:hypothetical protein
VHRCYTSAGMPTTRPRLTITETDNIAAALDAAAARWPDVSSRRELLLRLVEQGREVIERDRHELGRAPARGDPPHQRRSDGRLRTWLRGGFPRAL